MRYYSVTRRSLSTLWKKISVRRWVADLELAPRNCPLHSDVELEPLVREVLSRQNAELAELYSRHTQAPPIKIGVEFEVLVTCQYGHEIECRGKQWEHEDAWADAVPVPA